jgi:hypothetical protein
MPSDQEMPEKDTGESEQPRSSAAVGAAVGALDGLILGFACALACFWLLDPDELFWIWLCGGVLMGSLVGAPVGWIETRRGRPIADLNIATHLGIVYGLLPGGLLLVGGAPLIRGRFSGYVILGLGFAGPMLGMLIGGVLDRACDSFFRTRPPNPQEGEP